ncbi:Cupin domain-containing protein [Sinosporangium album]|uniref:Cupin domain-containing protein n=1 Tax=Sinosporangium album TaxID=504805 RepID=A0A1G7QU14_9ACTN|nr:cupin domain-containing protein [Sinosporangium album]SDG02016.1 Cupin domain-containing protein [Sinosporangium album]
MTRPVKIRYGTADATPSGMVVEEISTGAGEPAQAWPFQGSRFVVPSGAVSELDVHEVAELWLVRTGTGTVRSDREEIEVGPGDAVYFPSMVPHQVQAGAEPLEVFSVWWLGGGR